MANAAGGFDMPVHHQTFGSGQTVSGVSNVSKALCAQPERIALRKIVETPVLPL
jgi:hypothetical protein